MELETSNTIAPEEKSDCGVWQSRTPGSADAFAFVQEGGMEEMLYFNLTLLQLVDFLVYLFQFIVVRRPEILTAGRYD